MTGNTWDWTSSLYQSYPYDAADGREDPVAESARRVVCGGSWNYHQFGAGASFRCYFDAGYRDDDLGLRVVRPSPSLT